MEWLTIAAVVVILGTAVLLRWRRPAWYWLTFGALVAVVRLRPATARSWKPAG